MKALHIIFSQPDMTAEQVIREHEAAGIEVKRIDVGSAALSHEAYLDMVREIFASDKVFTWHR